MMYVKEPEGRKSYFAGVYISMYGKAYTAMAEGEIIGRDSDLSVSVREWDHSVIIMNVFIEYETTLKITVRK
ncbi:MAG: hypothetical protein ACOC4H_00750, partial [bacterium]